MSNSKPRKLKSFKDYYLGTLLRPRRTFEALLVDDRRLKFGLLALGINIVLYTLVYVFLAARGAAPSSFTPWLAILVGVLAFLSYQIMFLVFNR